MTRAAVGGFALPLAPKGARVVPVLGAATEKGARVPPGVVLNRRSSMISWNEPEVKSSMRDVAAGWRSSDLGDMTTSGLGKSRFIWRRRAWKKFAGVVIFAIG